VHIRVLGPVDALRDGEPVALGGPRPRTVVAALALAGEAVSVDRLVDEVWTSAPPRSAVATLQSYLSRLRRELGAPCLVNHGRGYRLVVDDGTLDVEVFRADLDAARTAVADGDLAAAAEAYRAALGTWRGEVAEGLEGGAIVREASARLHELRLIATEEQIDVALAAGRHQDVIPELDALTSSHPHRERLHGQRMLALYRAGRQVDALVGFQVARQQLVDGLGIEPGPGLQELQQRILAQDPALDRLDPAEVTGGGPLTERRGSAHARPSGSNGAVPVLPRRPDGPVRGGLPAPLDTFVGRAAERIEIAELLSETRLVTLVGAGGCGKTQLALRVAFDVHDRFPDGAWWVELAAQRDPGGVARTVGAALGIPEPTQGTWRDAVLDRLADGAQLLVLDNCEHLVEACAEFVATALRDCPSARVLATSREPLDVAGERAWRVPSLAVPQEPTTQAVLASEAAQLLEVRASAVRPGGRVVYSTCTISRRENEGLVEGVLAARPDLRAEPLGEIAPALAAADRRFVQNRPDRDSTDGFFIAALGRA
jgi:DNA-binding SARP family transcriptional activator